MSLKRLRKLHNMTQVDVCRAIGCPRPMYQMMENGKSPVFPQYLKSMAELFNVSKSYLSSINK